MALYGEEIDGARAVALGLAWETADVEEVEDRARALARRVATDPELARVAVRNFRRETEPALSWETATQFERPAQMWSMRRAADL